MDPDVIYELAKLATISGHLDQADNRYQQLVEMTNSSKAWTGLGLVRLTKLTELAANSAEVRFCIKAAKSADPANMMEVEGIFAEAILTIILDQMSTISQASGLEKQFKRQAKISAFAAVLGALPGPSSSLDRTSVMKTLDKVGTGLAIVNAASAAASYLTGEQAKAAKQKGWFIIHELVAIVDEVISLQNDVYDSFIKDYESAASSLKADFKDSSEFRDFEILHTNTQRYKFINGPLPSYIQCPACQMKLQLDQRERDSRRFLCPGCKQDIRVNKL